MKIRHANSKTEIVETSDAHKLGLPVAVIVSARRKLQFLRQARDERDIRAMKSLAFEKLKGDRKGEHSVRLNDQWRLVLRIDEECEPRELIILSIEDYH